MSDDNPTVYQGHCFCGAVAYQVTGEPLLMGYCHCRDCQSWTGTPITASAFWTHENVKVTRGVEHIHTFHRDTQSHSWRKSCSKCGGNVMNEHPDMIDVLAPTLPDLEYAPEYHVQYAESVLPVKDGLPKYRDFPERFGGTGELMAE